jgi:hypothetical protein
VNVRQDIDRLVVDESNIQGLTVSDLESVMLEIMRYEAVNGVLVSHDEMSDFTEDQLRFLESRQKRLPRHGAFCPWEARSQRNRRKRDRRRERQMKRRSK